MAVPTKLTSEDCGAPSLTGQGGTLYDVLKWALPQLGWSIEYDNDTDKIVFKNDPGGGLGGYLRIDDDPSSHSSSGQQARVNLFKTMSDIDTGTGETPVGNGLWITKHPTNGSSTAHPWRITGDEKSFILETSMTTPAGDDRWLFHEFGQLTPRRADDNTFHAIAHNFPPTSVGNPLISATVSPLTGGDSGIRFLEDTDGSNFTLSGRALLPSAFSGTTPASNVALGQIGRLNDGVLDKEYLTTAWLCDGDAHNRGAVRGVFWPVGDWRSKYGSIETFAGVVTPLGVRTLQLHYYSGRTNNNAAAASILLDRDGDWDD